MQSKFDVLSKDFNCLVSHFLEASAGTGKTFAIEHTVARLLQEEAGIDLKEILVVTFTRSAAFDLKQRIAATLNTQSKETQEFEKICKLKRAKARFEEAPIYTIHGFCMRMLKEFAPFADLSLSIEMNEMGSTNDEKRLVKDFLRYRLTTDMVSAAQLRLLFDINRSNEEAVIDLIVKYVNKDKEVAPLKNYKEIFLEIKARALEIEGYEHIREELVRYKDCFEKISNRQKQIKEEVFKEFEAFAQFLSNKNATLEDFEVCIAMGDPIKRYANKNKVLPEGLLRILKERITPLMQEVCDPNYILAHLVDLALKLKQSRGALEYLGPDDLLKVMLKSLDRPQFLHKVQEKFKVAIIDEFQDTDPIQWQIFKRLFVDNPLCTVYLVGDPKQSIYAFRNADIYTYLEAKKALKNGVLASLSTNYRSTIALTEALNQLFTKMPWMPLPKLSTNLLVEPVDAKKEAYPFNDGKGALHFFVVNSLNTKNADELFFPFLASEISHLISLGFHLCDISILVRDRFQETAVKEFLESHKIACLARRGLPLVDTKGFDSIYKLMKAIKYKDDASLRATVWIDPLFGKKIEELSSALKEDIPLPEENQPIYHYLDALISSLSQQILSHEGGGELLRHLRQTLELILEHCPITARANQVYEFLKNAKNEHKAHLALSDDLDAVTIMTMHSSKGLEFEIVFALGVASRIKKEEELLEEDAKLIPTDRTTLTYELFDKERNAEKARQLYVALTRAKKRLYVPIQIMEAEKSDALLSPIELYLQSMKIDQDNIIEKLEELKNQASITYETLEEKEVVASLILEEPKRSFHDPLTPSIIKEKTKIYSYTMLATPSSSPPFLGQKDFPSNSEVGIILHEIFEKEAITQEEVKAILYGTILESYFEVIQEMVAGTLKAPLHSAYATFTLSDIDPLKKIKEVEFVIPWDNENGFLTGFIDLIFEYQNRFYILDWKSNLLADYSQKSLDLEMKRHCYDLQEKIYRDALRNYLTRIDQREFEQSFGGSFYIFLRGIKEGGGIWYKP